MEQADVSLKLVLQILSEAYPQELIELDFGEIETWLDLEHIAVMVKGPYIYFYNCQDKTYGQKADICFYRERELADYLNVDYDKIMLEVYNSLIK